MRLRGRWARAVQVRSRAAKSRAVSNRNCVGAIRGGEQRNENDYSVTQIAHVGGRRGLDSVGVAGRACERKAKPVGALKVGDGMAGSSLAVNRETRRGRWSHGCQSWSQRRQPQTLFENSTEPPREGTRPTGNGGKRVFCRPGAPTGRVFKLALRLKLGIVCKELAWAAAAGFGRAAAAPAFSEINADDAA